MVGRRVGVQGAVWVSDKGDSLVRIDPASNRIVATIHTGMALGAVAVADGVVWVVDTQEGRVRAIDPATNRIVLTLRVGRGPSDLAASDSSLWVLNQIDGTVTLVRIAR